MKSFTPNKCEKPEYSRVLQPLLISTGTLDKAESSTCTRFDWIYLEHAGFPPAILQILHLKHTPENQTVHELLPRGRIQKEFQKMN